MLIGDLDMDDYLMDSLRIEPLALQEEFRNQAPHAAYWNERTALAKDSFLKAKKVHEDERAKAYLILREKFSISGQKFTEAVLESAVTLNEDVSTARLNLIDAEVALSRALGEADAIKTKREMLVSMGAQIRAEMQGDPALKHMHADARKARLNNEGEG